MLTVKGVVQGPKGMLLEPFSKATKNEMWRINDICGRCVVNLTLSPLKAC